MYLCSENKGADQLCSYRTADLRLCFRLCRLLVFPCGGSIIATNLKVRLLAKCEHAHWRIGHLWH